MIKNNDKEILEETNANKAINQMLKYSAAALSVISFITTMNGLNGIVVDNIFAAGLISFGIQSIILVMGLQFFYIAKIIWKQSVKKFLKFCLISFMILLYCFSIAFSSFFSFVYLTNAAYTSVKATDYNIEIENFLVASTKEVKSINEQIGKVLLQKVQNELPNISDLLEKYSGDASEKVTKIVKSIKKYKESQIPKKFEFNTELAIATYEGVNGSNSANDELKASCESLKTQVNAYIAFYNNDYYPFYSNLYDELNNQEDSSKAENQIKNISVKIKEIKKQKQKLNKISHYRESINKYVKSTCSGIAAYYDLLIGKLNEISNNYKEIKNNDKTENMSLQSVYETIYSPENVSPEKIDQSITELKKIITEYFHNTDLNVNDSNVNQQENNYIKDLSSCITYLGEFQKHQVLDSKIKKFEDKQLNKVYIVINQSSKDSSSEETAVNKVNEDIWSKNRHQDIASFINLLKSIPDLDLILTAFDQSNDIPSSVGSSINYLKNKNKEEYINNTISESYKYIRNKLEEISDMERAWNFLHSENNFLAIFCFILALFLDIASFLIGIFLYYNKSKKVSYKLN